MTFPIPTRSGFSASPQVATDVWARFVGIFGGKAVAAKYGDSPPAEWVSVLGSLNRYQLDRGMRRLVASGRAHVPSLPEFVKLCRSVADDELDARPADAEIASDGWEGKHWETAANMHMRAHIAKQLSEKPRRYGRPASVKYMQASPDDFKKLGMDVDMHKLDASPEFIVNVELLVRAKNLWVSDMKDLAANTTTGEVDAKMQRKIWDDYFGKAEAYIERKMKQ